MKKVFFAFASILCVFGTVGCSKGLNPEEKSGDKYFVEESKVYRYETPQEFLDFVEATYYLDQIEEAGIILGLLSSGDILRMANKLFFENVTGGHISRLCVERHNFLYRTVDGQGNPITLSGALVLPLSADGKLTHQLDDITLSSPWYMDQDECPTVKGNLVMYRALYNEAVIIPDTQGLGTTYGVYKAPFVEWPQLARQTIDCELAALELMETLNVSLAKGYQTKGMAMSKGAPVMMTVQKMLENTEPAAVRDLIRMRSNYCATGPYDTYGMFTDLEVWNAQKEKLWALLLLINSAYYGHPDVFRDYKLSDFYSDEFNSVKVSDGKGGEYTLADKMSDKLGVSSKDFTKYGLDAAEKIVNPRFFAEDGGFNESDPLVAAFFKILKDNDAAKGWSPKCKLLMEHSMNDDVASYKYSSQSYSNLRMDERGLVNSNVTQHTYYSWDHSTVSAFAIIRMVLLENPAEESFIDLLDVESLLNSLMEKLFG
ncbi:MAG: hypothetical protein MJY61_05040 [Bacteroidales bacterium]|nr:hypothetical protein [Bacteroidales bacterium]